MDLYQGRNVIDGRMGEQIAGGEIGQENVVAFREDTFQNVETTMVVMVD
jgi:hypothetical protein